MNYSAQERTFLALSTAFTFLCLGVEPVQAQEFTPTEKALYVSMQAATLVDWAQTRGIAGSCGPVENDPNRPGYGQTKRFKEANPLMGDCPSVGRVNGFMASRLVLQHVAAMSLPAAYRLPVMTTLTVAYTAVALHNNKTGVRIGGRDVALMAGVAAGAVLGAKLNGWAFTPWGVSYSREF